MEVNSSFVFFRQGLNNLARTIGRVVIDHENGHIVPRLENAVDNGLDVRCLIVGRHDDEHWPARVARRRAGRR